jgi:cell division protein FtsW
MVYSSSYIYAKDLFGDSAYFLKKQILFLLAGSGLGYVISRTRFQFWIKYSSYFNIVIAVLLIFTFIPGIGQTVKGANRWIGLGFINFQPGEFAKVSITLCALYFFENYSKFKSRQLAVQACFLLLPMVFIIRQPDYGTFLICLCGILFACYVSSFPRKYFYSICAVGTSLVLLTIFIQPYRVKRVLAFLDPWKNAKTTGFQVVQSFLAFANGSFWGMGLGNSKEKLFYLPEAHNDFIFSVIGEELGFVGVLICLALFGALLYWGFKLSIYCKKRFCSLTIATMIFLIGLQIIINIGVVMGLLPTKGLNLPFISYGGSSLLANLFIVGIIFSAMRYCRTRENY